MAQEHDPFVWLSPDQAGNNEDYDQYARRVRRDLVQYFAGNGCIDADDLAAETLQRLIEKMHKGEVPRIDSATDRKRYFFGIARNVLREWHRRPASRETELREGDEGQQYSLPPVDLVAEECLELIKRLVEDTLQDLSPAEQELLYHSDLTARG